MRGDSLRDLYAKTLAVLGLGLLAGAGAIVDYWPVGAALPAVGSARLPRPEVPALTRNFNQKIPAPVLEPARPAYVRGTIHPKNVGTARFTTASLELRMPAPLPVATEPAVFMAAVPALIAPIEDHLPAILAADRDVEWYSVEPAAPVASSQPGLIGGALRKTKDSLIKTGAVTGATIADAFRGAFGAFKKLSPF